jgi:hypothetical protein
MRTPDEVARRLRKLIYPWQPWRKLNCGTHPPERVSPRVSLNQIGWASVTDEHGEVDFYVLVAETRTGRLRFALVDSRDANAIPPWKPVLASFVGRQGYLAARHQLRLYDRMPSYSERPTGDLQPSQVA